MAAASPAPAAAADDGKQKVLVSISQGSSPAEVWNWLQSLPPLISSGLKHSKFADVDGKILFSLTIAGLVPLLMPNKEAVQPLYDEIQKIKEVELRPTMHRLSTTAGSLPKGWSRFTDPDHDDMPYYVNDATGETTWVKPVDMATAIKVSCGKCKVVLAVNVPKPGEHTVMCPKCKTYSKFTVGAA